MVHDVQLILTSWFKFYSLKESEFLLHNVTDVELSNLVKQ